MINRILMALAFSAAVSFAVVGPALAADKDSSKKESSSTEATKADNSKVNKQIREGKESTADQQSQSKADIKITQEIRRALVKDKQLSTYAHNVKIITRDGKVTLKGPVRSEHEKAMVEKIASGVAKGKVSNELTVAASKRSEKEKSKEKTRHTD